MPFDLAKIGQLLRTAREEKGLTIDQVSASLFIRKTTLKAIEGGDWEKLPHVVYVKGYVTQYASFLDLLDAIRPDLASIDAPQKERQEAPAREAMPMGRSLKKRIAGVFAMGMVLVAFLVFVNVRRPPGVAGTQAKPAPAPQNPGTPAAQAPVASVAPEATKPADQLDENSYQTVSGQDRTEGAYDRTGEKVVLDPKKLMVVAQERTWVAVVIDGSERKEFTLNPEEVIVLNAKEKFDLLIGNAGGVRLYYNGKDVGFTGKSGQVKRITLS